MAIPATAGIGLRTPHMPALANGDAPAPPWVEIHSENFICDGGPRLAMLDVIAAQVPVSCHGVGLSLGSAEGIDGAHLQRLKKLFDRVRPGLVSEHLAWSGIDGVYVNDLLPLPYTDDALDTVSRNVDAAQNFLGRQILIENPSAYISFTASTMRESEFLARLAERTGCGLLLDANNIYVSAANLHFDARDYLRDFPLTAVKEIHLAGHTAANGLLIDTHGSHVCEGVWNLYADVVARTGQVPTLIEWDRDLPDFSTLMQEALTAQRVLNVAEAHNRVA